MKFRINARNNDSEFVDVYRHSRYNVLIMVDKLNFGDTALNIIDLANYLNEHNVGVVILTTEAKKRHLLNKNVKLIENSLFSQYFPPLEPFKRYIFKKICKTFNIYITLVYSVNFAKYAYFASKKERKIPFIAYVNELYNVSTRYLRRKYSIMTKADTIIAPSMFVCDYLLDLYNIDFGKIKLITNGVDMSTFDTSEVSKGRFTDIFNKIGFDIVDKKIFICPSKLTDGKGQMLLLDAIKGIKDDDFFCLLVGDFNEDSVVFVKQLTARIKTLNIFDKIRIINNIDDISALYLASYAVLCISQKEEPSSRTPIEVGAMHRPIISTSLGAMNNYVINQQTGFVIRPNSANSIRDAIERMLGMSKDEYERMCDNAEKYIRKYFNMAQALHNIDNILMDQVDRVVKKFLIN